MLGGVLLAVLVGVLCGVFTGLVPGIHVNLVAAGLVLLSPRLLTFLSPIQLSAFIVSLGITHTFTDIIPSVFLSAPKSDTSLVALPAHRMLARGKGREAVLLATEAGVLCLLTLALLSPLIVAIIRQIYPLLERVMGGLLACVIAWMVLRIRGWAKRFWGLVVLALSGSLGLTVLNHPAFREPMFPLLTGLFGTSLLLVSLESRAQPPPQRAPGRGVNFKTSIRTTLGSVVGGIISGVMPGLGSSQAAMLGKPLCGRVGSRGFIMLVGGVNTANFFVSLLTLYTTGKARNGAVLTLARFIPKLQLSQLAMLLCVAMLAGGIAAVLTLMIARGAAYAIPKISYPWLCLGVLTLLIFLCLKLSGLIGLAVLSTSTAIGLLPHATSTPKSLCMGTILIPVAVYFLA